MPMSSLDNTLGQLRLLGLIVGVIALLALAGVAWWVIHLELEPLRRIKNTAQEIAAGDLSQRVTNPDTRTEVGQLAVSLNEMMGQIESTFTQRSASEARLCQFVVDASHELRTPLTSIRGYAEFFRRGARSNPEDLDKAMSRIEGEATRMGHLVEDLLLLARLDESRPLKLQPIDLAQVVADATADQAVVKPHRPITILASEPVLVLADEARLRQVVVNLVRNAVMHTPAKTPIEVKVTANEGVGVLEVIDYGPGISEAAAQHIFERFYRADSPRRRATGGTGLGLAIVQAIVTAHRGQASWHPTPGGGATFVVELPKAP
jgi:two-component system OmpR family sensor kinase